MTSIETVAQKYRALNCGHLAAGLASLLGAAEANALSYLHLVEQLVDLELQGREKNRLAMNLRKAGFPMPSSAWRNSTTATRPPSPSVRSPRCWTSASWRNAPTWSSSARPASARPIWPIGIGLKAIEAGYKVLFTTTLALVETARTRRAQGRTEKEDRQLAQVRPAHHRRVGLSAL